MTNAFRLLFLLAFLLFASCGSRPSGESSDIFSDSLSIARGKLMVNQHCSSCHSMAHENAGPPLEGLTTVVSVEWIKNFIKSPQTVIESGDERAQQLIVKYNEVMPSFDRFTEDELNEIVAYLDTQRRP